MELSIVTGFTGHFKDNFFLDVKTKASFDGQFPSVMIVIVRSVPGWPQSCGECRENGANIKHGSAA